MKPRAVVFLVRGLDSVRVRGDRRTAEMVSEQVGQRPVRADGGKLLIYFFRNSSGSIPACLRMARSVPSGMSPG